jgi:hypothetical protein
MIFSQYLQRETEHRPPPPRGRPLAVINVRLSMFDALIRVPADLTADEARRVCGLITALVPAAIEAQANEGAK